MKLLFRERSWVGLDEMLEVVPVGNLLNLRCISFGSDFEFQTCVLIRSNHLLPIPFAYIVPPHTFFFTTLMLYRRVLRRGCGSTALA